MGKTSVVCLLALLLAPAAMPQTAPDLSGVWKANKEQSKMGRPLGDADYYVRIEQNGSTVKQQFMTTGPHEDERSSFSYDTSAPANTNTIRGSKITSKVSSSDGSLVIDSSGEMRGHAFTSQEKWTLSPDHKTLTLVRTGGREPETIVFEKQPDSAAELFTKPPRSAKEVYKNVQVLDVPAPELIDAMISYTRALGVRCDFCHVQGHFDQDTKPEKKMARKMIAMTQGINRDTFGGTQRVACWTCHRGQHEPAREPAQ